MHWNEVASSLYPWDLLDEGVEPILDVLERDTLTNSVYLVALMHDEKRPLTDFYYPHNPRRKVYWTEDSRAYWTPDPAAYADSRIKPRVSGDAELSGTDWLQVLIDAARRRGMTTGAELSHTWLDKQRMAGELADCVQRDVFGRPLEGHACFNHPDVVAYGRALYGDLAGHYDLDFIQTCVIGFHPGRHQPWTVLAGGEAENVAGITTGGCFCEHCRAAAEGRGIDWDAMVERLRWLAEGHNDYHHRQAFELRLLRAAYVSAAALLTEVPELYTFLKFRTDSLTSFCRTLYHSVHAIRPGIDVRLNHFAQRPELMGLDLRAVGGMMDSVRSCDYSEHFGDPARMEFKRKFLHNIRRAVGVKKTVLSAISPRPRATPELVKQGIRISAECGADGLMIGHYDGAWPDCLRAVRAGIEEAGITVAGRR